MFAALINLKKNTLFGRRKLKFGRQKSHCGELHTELSRHSIEQILMSSKQQPLLPQPIDRRAHQKMDTVKIDKWMNGWDGMNFLKKENCFSVFFFFFLLLDFFFEIFFIQFHRMNANRTIVFPILFHPKKITCLRNWLEIL